MIEAVNALKIHAMKKQFEKAGTVVTPLPEENENAEQQ